MTTENTAPLTASKLYECDATFKALVDSWVEHRRCPLVMVDRLMEFDLFAAAECARWAATEDKRPIDRDQRGDSYPYPLIDYGGNYAWAVFESRHEYARDVPFGRIACSFDVDNKPEHPERVAILWLLDNWKSG